MDVKLDTLAEEFRNRVEELVPGGCREKSLAITNLEQAVLWAERARNVTGGVSRLRLYNNPKEVGWLGYIEGDQGRGVEAWVTLEAQVIPNIHQMPSAYHVNPETLPSIEAQAASIPAERDSLPLLQRGLIWHGPGRVGDIEVFMKDHPDAEAFTLSREALAGVIAHLWDENKRREEAEKAFAAVHPHPETLHGEPEG